MTALRFSEKPSDLQVAVHPIVVLSISDHLARHALRRPSDSAAAAAADADADAVAAPLLGILLGSQDGHRVSIRRTFDIGVERDAAGAYTVQDEVLEFCEAIEPGLIPIGYYVILPKSGPDARLRDIHHVLIRRFRTHNFLLLGFDPDRPTAPGASLPISLYETQLLSADPDAADPDAAAALLEVPQFSVSTDPAEMIGMDSVARGGGNAKAVAPLAADPDASPSPQPQTTKAKAPAEPDLQLSRDEEDAIAALKTKANAVRMLQARIDLLAAYLAQLPPPSSSSSSSSSAAAAAADTATTAPRDHALLRDILAAVVQLGLVAPADSAGFTAELAAEDHALHTVALLNEALEAATGARAANRKFVVAGASAAVSQGMGMSRAGLLHSMHTGRMEFVGVAAGSGGAKASMAAMQRRQMQAGKARE